MGIRWPNGTVETFENPAINTTHSITQSITQSTITAVTELAPIGFAVAPNPDEVLWW